jgi:uncharacterized protein DUF4352
MRNSSIGTIILTLLVVLALAIFGLLIFQGLWLKKVQQMLNSNRSSGQPVSTAAVSGFSFPTASDAVSQGVESIVGNVGITVTRVINPANSYVGKAAKYTTLDKGDQYLLVDIKVRCISSKEKCRLTEFDFGVESNAGRDYPAELSGNFSDLKGLFEGGDIEPGKSMSGSIIFVIQKGESGLVLVYPRLFNFGGSAKFTLGR